MYVFVSLSFVPLWSHISIENFEINLLTSWMLTSIIYYNLFKERIARLSLILETLGNKAGRFGNDSFRIVTRHIGKQNLLINGQNDKKLHLLT